MQNKYMEEHLKSGVCLDVRKIGRGRPYRDDDLPVVFELDEFHEGLDYCDARTERFVWSIGREIATGRIVAALDSRFYSEWAKQEGWECIWLR